MKYNILTLCLAVLVSAHVAAAAEDSESSSVKISNPAKPAIVRLFVAGGHVKVIGGEAGDNVSVRSDAPPEAKSETRPDGLRVLSTSSSYSLSEKNNVVELNYGRGSFPGGASDANFTVNVPRNASIEIKDGWNTEIAVENVNGDIEIKNLNGGVQLQHIGGAALVETMNGEIHADFDAVTPGKAISFTSMNGAVEMHLPQDSKANVRFRTQNGSILTDFPESILDTKSTNGGARRARRNDGSPDAAVAAADVARAEADRARDAASAARDADRAAIDAARDASANRDAEDDDRSDGAKENRHGHPSFPRPPRVPPIPPIAGGKVVSGTLNGGGADIQVATMNGDIIVRKK
ncbi:MAG TPA: DUF4097 family beta strand repeat-containing protein [Opitutaceae bacterium]|nr:DUF4097 family beta strand repeat-containing protein [Opitutaceae bacterium]